MADSLKLSTADGSDDRRRVMLWNLTEIVQNRMSHLQNPADCANARKLVCQLNKGCGFGCQLHHVMYCLMVAYGTERTMILDSRGWRYSQRGWDSIFLPVSSSCRNITDDNAETWKGTLLWLIWSDNHDKLFRGGISIECQIGQFANYRWTTTTSAVPTAKLSRGVLRKACYTL